MIYSNVNNQPQGIYSIHCCVITSYMQRLDTFIVSITDFLPYTLSRSQLKHHITQVYVNGKPAKFSHKLTLKDEIRIFFRAHHTTRTHRSLRDSAPNVAQHWDIKTSILYEDEQVMILNKPRGIVVHPGAGNIHNTLIDYVYEYLKSSCYEDFLQRRLGIVHRLDKDTTGAIVIAKSTYIHDLIATQFSARKVYKQYIAIVHKSPQILHGVIEKNIVRNPFQRKKFMVTPHKDKGRHAITEYDVLYTNKEFSVIACIPKTGRTHQIRVHMQYLGTPIVGDATYSRTKYVWSTVAPQDLPQTHEPLMLHAHTIAFTISDKNFHKEYRCSAPLPTEMTTMMRYIKMPDTILSHL